MAVREICRLGNPALRVTCSPVKSFGSEALHSLVSELRETLHDYRDRRGFGRGIAAPQIGGTERVIVIDVGTPLAIVNPVITHRSRKRCMLWDECFSFPELVVKVSRNLAIEVRYQDPEGKKRTMKAEGGLSELLQHEIDHLNGILAIDRAVDSRHIVFRDEYTKWEHGAGVTM